jgi:hypothetical protein
MNKAGVKDRSVLGFVDLSPRQQSPPAYICSGGIPQDRILDAVTVLVEQRLEPRQERLDIIVGDLVGASGHVFHDPRVDDLLLPSKRTPV